MASAPNPYSWGMPNTPPNAPRLDLTTDFHGHTVADPYRWLEDPATAEADTESAPLWQQWRADWDSRQAQTLVEARQDWDQTTHFGERLTALLQGGFTGMPTWRGDRQFYSKREPGQQFPVLYTVEAGGEARVLIDPMQIDPTGQTTLDSFSPSWDGSKLATLMSEGGDEESVLRVLDVATGEIIDGPIDRTRFSSVAWLPDGQSFYYVRRLAPELVPAGEEQFHRRVYLHQLGADPDTDVEVFGSGRKKTEYFSASVSRDGLWLTVDASEGTAPRNDVYLASISQNPAQPDLQPVVEGLDAMTALSIRRDGRMFVWTDDGAPRGKILLGEPRNPTPEHWREIVAEDSDSVLESFGLLDGPDTPDQYLILGRTRHSIGELSLLESDSGAFIRTLEAPGLGTIAGPVGRPEGSTESWYLYTDNTTPPHVYKYDVLTNTTELWASPPGSITVPTVHSEQITYKSADGTDVRMYIMAPGADKSAPRPAILYGYGGFGIALQPAFNPGALAWVESGGVYAIANLRGGAEEGEDWHRAGMLANKQNVFDDFHAAAEYLVAQGWTTAAQLCISGGSNGGLLVGAALVQRPELYGSVICTAPLLDMIRYTTSQLGATWTVEYGDPQVPVEFDWLIDYSPYHNVQDGVSYPATLMMVFDNDTRTDPMHGRKMVAALQHAQAGSAPIILRTEANVGHGARALDKSVAETAESLAFAAHETGLNP